MVIGVYDFEYGANDEYRNAYIINLKVSKKHLIL